MPLILFHLVEWMDQPYSLNVNAINSRWFKSENIDSWGQIVIKYTEKNIRVITQAPRSGIYKMHEDGTIAFSRMDTHRRAVETEKEAFFLRISRRNDYLYEGADMGILVMRGRLMTDDFKLLPRALRWIDKIKSQYESDEFIPAARPEAMEIGGFKMI